MKRFLVTLQLIMVFVTFPLVVCIDIVFWNLIFGKHYGYISPKESVTKLWSTWKRDFKETVLAR